MRRTLTMLSVATAATMATPPAATAQFNSSMTAVCAVQHPCSVIVFELSTDPGWLATMINLSTTTGGLLFNPFGGNTVVSTDFAGNNQLGWSVVPLGGSGRTALALDNTNLGAATPLFIRMDVIVDPLGEFALNQTAHFTFGVVATNPGLNDVSGASFGTAHITPEPVTAALLATGLLGIGGVGAFRRRKQRLE